MLIGFSAFALGAIGLWSSMRANADIGAFEVSSFFLAGGAGFAIASILLRRWLPHLPYAG
jgi:hypothetical protein